MSNGNMTAELAAALARLDTTKPVKDYKGEFIGKGDHLLMIVETSSYVKDGEGLTAKILFEVVTSTDSHKPGDLVVRVFKLQKPPKFASQTSDADVYADILRKVSGRAEGTPVSDLSRAILLDRRDEQLLRGVLIRGYGTMNAKGTYVNVSWNAVDQTPEQIRARRAQVDAKANAAPPAQAPAAHAPLVAYAQIPAPAPQYATPVAPPAYAPVAQPPPPVWDPATGQWVFQQPATPAAPAAPTSPLLSQIPGFNR